MYEQHTRHHPRTRRTIQDWASHEVPTQALETARSIALATEAAISFVWTACFYAGHAISGKFEPCRDSEDPHLQMYCSLASFVYSSSNGMSSYFSCGCASIWRGMILSNTNRIPMISLFQLPLYKSSKQRQHYWVSECPGGPVSVSLLLVSLAPLPAMYDRFNTKNFSWSALPITRRTFLLRRNHLRGLVFWKHIQGELTTL